MKQGRFVLQNLALLRRVKGNVSRHLGSRADEAHVADQHVPKLGQLIQLGPAQETPDPGNSRVMFRGDRQPQLVGVDHHGTEFPDAEGPAKLTHADLTIENGAAVRELDQQANQQAEGQQCQ